MTTKVLAGLTALSAFAFVLKTNEPAVSKAGGASADASAGSEKAAPAAINPHLTAADFNATQDQTAIKKCLDGFKARRLGKSPKGDEDCGVEVYQFLACPYCSKVKGVLDFNKIPYRTVTVDPLSFRHMPDTPYTMVPQLQLIVNPDAPEGSPARGPIIVDSDAITAKLSEPLGFKAQLTDPRVAEAREWLNNAYSRSTFVAVYSSWINAYEAYAHCVPAQYQHLPLRVVGATGMYGIASKKVYPRLFEHTDIKKDESIESLLQRQTTSFINRFNLPATDAYHGGKTPDIADIEMFAMSGTVLRHAHMSQALDTGSGPFHEWLQRMRPQMTNQSTGNRGSEILS